MCRVLTFVGAIGLMVWFAGWSDRNAFVAAQDRELPVNQTLDGAVFGLAQDVIEFLKSDRLRANGSKIRLGRISSDGIPDGNYDQFFSDALGRHLSAAEVIDERSTLLLNVEYAYLESQTELNRGLRIIRITAELKERGRTIHPFNPREINNASEINRIVGNTLTPPVLDGKGQAFDRFMERLQATENAMENPAFDVVNGTQVAAPGGATYTVEIRRRAGGKGDLLPVKPVDQRGLAFTPVEIGDTYQIALYNHDPNSDAVARVEIDGLDVIHTFLEDRDPQGKKVNYPGYFIPRATVQGPGVHVVPGWLRTVKSGDDNVFDFLVNELGKGAASALKVQGSTGVISVRFFDVFPSDGKLSYGGFGKTDKGEAHRADYKTIPVQVGSEPVAQISVRYSRRPE